MSLRTAQVATVCICAVVIAFGGIIAYVGVA